MSSPMNTVSRIFVSSFKSPWLKAIASIAVLLVVGTLSETSSAQDKSPRLIRLPPQNVDGNNRELSGREFWQMLSDAMRPPTSDEHPEVVQFFHDNTPHRMEAYEKLPDGRPAKSVALDVMIRRYNQLQRTKRQDPELYDILIKRIQLQDDAMAMVDGDETAQKDFRTKVRALVTASLDERQHRIDALEKSLADQKAQLEKDKGNVDGLVDENIKQLNNDSKVYKRRLDGVKARFGNNNGSTAPQTTNDADTSRGR